MSCLFLLTLGCADDVWFVTEWRGGTMFAEEIIMTKQRRRLQLSFSAGMGRQGLWQWRKSLSGRYRSTLSRHLQQCGERDPASPAVAETGRGETQQNDLHLVAVSEVLQQCWSKGYRVFSAGRYNMFITTTSALCVCSRASIIRVNTTRSRKQLLPTTTSTSIRLFQSKGFTFKFSLYFQSQMSHCFSWQ